MNGIVKISSEIKYIDIHLTSSPKLRASVRKKVGQDISTEISSSGNTLFTVYKLEGLRNLVNFMNVVLEEVEALDNEDINL